MFNNIFCKIKSRKVIHWGVARGNRGTVLISSLKCNFSIYLDIQVYYFDIQAITTLLAVYWFFMCLFLLLIHFSILQRLSGKVTFYGTQKPTPPTVLNLQPSDWVHYEEERSVYYHLSRFSYKLVIYFLNNF